MVKGHGKKQRAKNRARRTGAAHASAAANTVHTHEPLPDLSVLPLVPHGGGQVLDLDLAARLVAACRAACRPCQKSLAGQMREDRPTLAALAGCIFGTLPTAGAFASGTTREWAVLARAARARGNGVEALAAVRAMTEEQASDLLEDALDHWAMGEATPEDIANMIQVITPEDLGMPAEDVAAAVDPQTQVSLYADRPAGADGAGTAGGSYRLHLGYVEMADGRPLPLIAFEPRDEKGTGLKHLREGCRWQPWDGHAETLPELDFYWRIRTSIPTQALAKIVHTDWEGWDDIELWRGEVKVPEDWWQLLDVASHALLCGPVSSPDSDALLAAAAKGELVAVIARASFR